jgi:NADH-quinone oxidoreductase subunit F
VGEETALLDSLDGKRGFPRIKPPSYPTTFGLYGQPTVVNNVETLSALPWIINNGASAFAKLGGGKSLGSRLFCLSGAVQNPGNYEVELQKLTFRDLFYASHLGGGIRRGNQLTAFITGASFPWLFPEHLDLHLDIDEVAKNGSSLGSGIMVLDEEVCPVKAAWRLVRFFHHESCGQCTPCREGLGWLEKILWRIETGSGRPEDLDLLQGVASNISPGPFPRPPLKGQEGVPFPYKQTTICALGPSGVSPIVSSLYGFRDSYERHIEQGKCPSGTS